MNACRGILHVKAEVFGKSFHCRFAGVVCCVAWWVRNTLLTSCNDNGGWNARIARPEGWGITVQAVDHPIEIRVENLYKSGTHENHKN